MKKLMVCILSILAFSMQMSAMAEQQDVIDDRLVGEWEGDRSTSKNCQYMAWKINRISDGNFVISFFSDKERHISQSQSVGRWWTQGGKFYQLVPGLMEKPDVYTYTVLDAHTIKFEINSKDATRGCEGNYVFTDNKVKRYIPSKESKDAILEEIIEKLPFSIVFHAISNSDEFKKKAQKISTDYINDKNSTHVCPNVALVGISAALNRRVQRMVVAEEQAYENYKNKARKILASASDEDMQILRRADSLKDNQILLRLMPNGQQMVSEYVMDKNNNELDASTQLSAELTQAEESCAKK